MQAVHITWFDSIHSSGWQSLSSFKEFAKKPSLQLESVGFLAWENDDYIVIVQSIGPDDIDAMMKIPRCSIVSVRVLAEITVPDEKA